MRIRKLFKIAAWIVGILVALLLIVIVLAAITSGSRMSHKSALPHGSDSPTVLAESAEATAEFQFESDTCGLHTIRTIYKAHGLNPDEENLRVRLGLKVPSNPFDATTTGTLQPDMIRVLAQDGFKTELLNLDDEGAAKKQLIAHLRSRKMAAILISRRENGNMHWVTASGFSGIQITILDSLFRDSYNESPDDFIHNCVLSCLLIEVTSPTVKTTRLEGTPELAKTARRAALLKARRKES